MDINNYSIHTDETNADNKVMENNIYGGAKNTYSIKDNEDDKDDKDNEDNKDDKDKHNEDNKDDKDDKDDLEDKEDKDDNDKHNEDDKDKHNEEDKEDKEDKDEIYDTNNMSNNSIDIEYNIDYLIDDDEKLIDVEKIKIQVDTYIDNYNSEIMTKYKNTFNKLYQRYSNKKYKINILPLKDKYNRSKIIVTKNDKKETIVTELIKPHYLYYDDNANLYKLKNKISNERAELLYKYQLLVSQVNVSPEDKSKFEKERIQFIKLLEEYYIYTLYHKKINKISVNNKTNLIIQSNYFIDKEDKIISVLSGDTYLIDNNLINNINNYNIDNLTKYNNIILQLTGKNQKEIIKDTKLIEEIKIYLNKKEKVEFMKSIDIDKKLQDNYIKYIIVSLPILNN